MDHRTLAELEAGLDEIRRSPAEAGTLELIVRRPGVDERETLEEAQLDRMEGLVGDDWRARESAKNAAPNPDSQLTLTNARGVYAKVVDPGAVRRGDEIRKL